MSLVYQIHKTKDSFEIIEKKLELKKLESSQILLKQKAVGLNLEDIVDLRFHQEGDAWTPCYEACGVIEDMGANITRFKKGDLVAYATNTFGALRDYKIIHEDHLIPIQDLPIETVAGSLRKYLTAHTCIHRAYLFPEKSLVLVNNATLPAALAVAIMAKANSAKVIGYAADKAEFELLKKIGLYHDAFLVETLEDAKVKGQEMLQHGVRAVYDSLGGAETAKAFCLLGYFGAVVNYAQIKGLPQKIDFQSAIKRCSNLVLVNPDKYKESKGEIVSAMLTISKMYETDALPFKIKQYSIDDAQEAFAYLAQPQYAENHSAVIMLK